VQQYSSAESDVTPIIKVMPHMGNKSPTIKILSQKIYIIEGGRFSPSRRRRAAPLDEVTALVASSSSRRPCSSLGGGRLV
jgi:hypothetical protein